MGQSLQDLSVKSLSTKRLKQDPLENHFGKIRQQDGNFDAPAPIQFARSFRTVLTKLTCHQQIEIVHRILTSYLGTNYQYFVDDSADIT